VRIVARVFLALSVVVSLSLGLVGSAGAAGNLSNLSHHLRPRAVDDPAWQFVDYQVHLNYDFVNGLREAQYDFTMADEPPYQLDAGGHLTGVPLPGVKSEGFFSGYLGPDPAADFVEVGGQIWLDSNNNPHSRSFMFSNSPVTCYTAVSRPFVTPQYYGCLGYNDALAISNPSGYHIGVIQAMGIGTPWQAYVQDSWTSVILGKFDTLTQRELWGPKITHEITFDPLTWGTTNPLPYLWSETNNPSYAMGPGSPLLPWWNTNVLSLSGTSNYADTDVSPNIGGDRCGSVYTFVHGPNSFPQDSWAVMSIAAVKANIWSLPWVVDFTCGGISSPWW